MLTRLADAERIHEISKRLLAEHRKYERIQSRDLRDAGPKQRAKHTNDLNYQAHDIVKIEAQLHAACVDASIADLRTPEEYAERDWRPTGFHHYRWTPAQPAALKSAGA